MPSVNWRRLERNGILEPALPNRIPLPPPIRIEMGPARRLLDNDRDA
jgi:hypothetical protein